MKLLLIRHGESEADILNVHEGRADFELTDRGRTQAQAMAKWVADRYNVDRIYCSTLKRAYSTASYLAEATGITLEPRAELMEFNNGLLAGLPFDEADIKYPKVDKLPPHIGMYEMESLYEFQHRADCILSEIISDNMKSNQEGCVAIVTHGGMINRLYHTFLKMRAEDEIFFPTDDTGIHYWYINNENCRYVIKSNMTEHLKDI